MSKKTKNSKPSMAKSLRQIDINQLALDFGLDNVKGHASIETENGKKMFAKVSDSIKPKRLYRGMVNGNVWYVHSHKSSNAIKSFRARALAEFGKYNITDLHVKTKDGEWSRVEYRVQKFKEGKFNGK